MERDAVFTGARGRTILDRFRLQGRVALVTGGGQGIGRAFCHALGEAGARVAVIDINRAGADAVVGELAEKGIEAVAVMADVTDRPSIDQMVRSILDRFERLDIAVNNAGVNANSAAEDTEAEEWDRTFAVNLRGVFQCCQAEARSMLAAGYGKIVNTGSISSIIVPHPQQQAAYNTAKAGVVQLTRSLAAEWAARGIRVNALSPGLVRTPLLEQPALKPLVGEWLPQIPAGQMAEVTDLQGAVVFLASEASDYMTGHNLVLDGGQTLW